MNRKPTTGSTGSEVVAACEQAYRAIRRKHPELPDAVFIIGTGQAKKGLRLGHFHADRWAGQDDDRIHEIFVAGEGLKRPAVEVFNTIMHEAVHALAAARQIKETSRGGRYHNKRFVALATEVGLAWPEGQQPDKTIGYSGVVLTEATLDRFEYRRAIQAIDKAKTAYLTLLPVIEKDKSNRNNVKLECPCGRIVRASAQVASEAPIICGECMDPFYAEDI